MLEPISKIKEELGINTNGRVQKYFTHKCRVYMDKYVPRDIGILRANVRENVDSIDYLSPYAHYQYIGQLYVDKVTKKGAFYSENYGYWSRPGVAKEKTEKKLNYHTQGTGSYWDKKMISAEGDKLKDDMQKYVDRGAK